MNITTVDDLHKALCIIKMYGGGTNEVIIRCEHYGDFIIKSMTSEEDGTVIVLNIVE